MAKSPGVFVTEKQIGFRPERIASHIDIYMFGSVESGFTGDYNSPIPIQNISDFDTKVGNTNDNRDYVRVIFQNDASARLNFIAVRPQFRSSIEVGDPVDLVQHSIQFESTSLSLNETITYTPTTGETVSQVRQEIVNRINQNVNLSPVLTATISANNTSDFFISSYTLDLTITGDANLVETSISDGSTLTAIDFTDSAAATLNENNNYDSGFIIMPEAYKLFTSNVDRTQIITSLEAVAVANNCVSIVDCKENIGNENALLNDRKLFNSPQGHSNMFAPWTLFNNGLEIVKIPPSCAVSAVWAYYVRKYGLSKSPLGTQKALVLAGINYPFTRSSSEFLNQEGVNLILNLGKTGYVIWGGRTMSNDSVYAFSSGRVVMNSINETLEAAFLPFIGKTIVVQGGTFHDLINTATAVMYRYYILGDLYGVTASEAYRVVCDSSNNDPVAINQGQITIDVYAKVSPTLEQVLVNTYKVAVGAVLDFA